MKLILQLSGGYHWFSRHVKDESTNKRCCRTIWHIGKVDLQRWAQSYCVGLGSNGNDARWNLVLILVEHSLECLGHFVLVHVWDFLGVRINCNFFSSTWWLSSILHNHVKIVFNRIIFSHDNIVLHPVHLSEDLLHHRCFGVKFVLCNAICEILRNKISTWHPDHEFDILFTRVAYVSRSLVIDLIFYKFWFHATSISILWV